MVWRRNASFFGRIRESICIWDSFYVNVSDDRLAVIGCRALGFPEASGSFRHALRLVTPAILRDSMGLNPLIQVWTKP